MAKFTKEERKYLKQFDDGWVNVMKGGMNRINAQFSGGIGQQRHELKKGSGHAQLDTVTAEGSWTKHVSAYSVFGHWCKSEGIERFHLVTQDDVERFLYYQESIGKRYDTITGYQTALNHVFAGTGVEGHPAYSAHHLGIQKDTERKNNLLENENRPKIPTKYDEQIDLIKMTGLRRDEMTRIGTKSLYEVSGNYYVSTIGKGGRPRFAEVLEWGKEAFKERYSDMIVKVDTTDDIPQTKEDIQEIYRTQKEIFERDIPSKYGLHVYRAIYAQDFYKELKESGKHDIEGQHFRLSDQFEGDEGLFRKITKSLGHNRVDRQLMLSYLRDE